MGETLTKDIRLTSVVQGSQAAQKVVGKWLVDGLTPRAFYHSYPQSYGRVEHAISAFKKEPDGSTLECVYWFFSTSEAV